MIAANRAFSQTGHFINCGALNMGKYLIAWLLGVPGIILLIVYFLF